MKAENSAVIVWLLCGYCAVIVRCGRDTSAGYTLALSDTVVPSRDGAFFEGTIYELTLQRREQEELFY